MSFDFTYKPSNNHTDLSETTLYLKFTVEKADGTALTAAVEAAPVNNTLHSIFANMQLLINSEKVTGNYKQYPYKAYHLTANCVSCFERSTNLFSMSQGDDHEYSVIIKKAEMSLRQVVVRDEVMEVHNKSVVNPRMGTFNYPISRSKVIKHTLAQEAQDYTFKLLDTTQIPTQLILGPIKELASAGSKGLNPFNFKH